MGDCSLLPAAGVTGADFLHEYVGRATETVLKSMPVTANVVVISPLELLHTVNEPEFLRPRHEREGTPVEPPIGACLPVHRVHGCGGGMNSTAPILIVEDHLDSSDLLVLYLGHAGLKAYSVPTPALAQIGFQWLRPSVVLLDLSMPTFDAACNLSREFQAAEWKPFIIGLNGFGFKTYEVSALASGCSMVLTKPLNLDNLLAAVRVGIGPVAATVATLNMRG